MSLCIRILTSEIEQVLCFGLPPDIQQVGTYGQKVEITFFLFWRWLSAATPIKAIGQTRRHLYNK